MFLLLKTGRKRANLPVNVQALANAMIVGFIGPSDILDYIHLFLSIVCDLSDTAIFPHRSAFCRH